MRVQTRRLGIVGGLSLALLAGCIDGKTEDIPEGYQNADVVRGGTLYDKFWVVADLNAPAEDHPLWASRPDQISNERTGSDTWRCKECHGWDYKGVDGAYGDGSHRTGFVGVFQISLLPQQTFDLLTDPTAHAYADAGLSDADNWDLTRFILEGLVDTEAFLSGQEFRGEQAPGQALYDDGIGSNASCTSCHGADGLEQPPGSTDFEDWPGLVAVENPWEFLHKVRFGQPGENMPAAATAGVSDDELADLGAYSQSLPIALP